MSSQVCLETSTAEKMDSENLFLPLFVAQIPQKTMKRIGLGMESWEYVVKHLANIELKNANLLNSFIDIETYSQIIGIGIKLFGRENFLHWYVKDVQAHHMGPLGIASNTAIDVRNSIHSWVDSGAILLPFAQFNLKNETDHFTLSCKMSADFYDPDNVYTELVILMLRKFLLDMVPGLKNIPISFAHSQHSSTEYYEKSFGESPTFNAKESSIIIPNTIWNLENIHYSPMIHQQAMQDCKTLKENSNSLTSIGQRVYQILLAASTNGSILTLGEVAERLNVSPRTLTRKLKKGDSSFRELQSTVRMELAKQQLKETTKPIKHICAMAGFNNMSAFSRAFRRYSNLCPNEFRQQSMTAVA